MFNPRIFENSILGGIPMLEVVGGIELENAALAVVPLRRSELHGEVVGPLAALRLVQHFGYSREVCDKVLEAVYRFPLPGDAAVSGVRVRFGDTEIVAELKEREQAETEYQEAKQQGKQAALTTRESPDVFTLHVAGLKPDQNVVVETSYVQLARPEGREWTLRVPLTTAPRYVRTDELTSRHAQGQPLALLRDPGHRFALNLTLHHAEEVKSPTHVVTVQRQAEKLRVTLQEGEVLPDRDCVLRWRTRQAERHPTLHVMLHDDPATGYQYFMALVAPPATHDYGRGVPREVALVVDHSGSMEGAKWEAADWTVERFLADLYEHDGFALGLFHDSVRWFKKEMAAAQRETVEKAIHFLKTTRDSGGTNLGVALEQALSLPRLSGQPARHVLIVTDAEVTDAGRILRLADEEAKRKESRRISVICIDAAPNDFLATELASRGGGVARFLTSQPDQGDVTTALGEVLADWAEPVLAGLTLEINRAGAESTDRTVQHEAGRSVIDLGDLPAGRAIWVGGRLPRGEGLLRFRLAARGLEVATTEMESSTAGDHRALKALFGARRVLGLEFLIHSGYRGEQLEEQLRRLGYDPQKALIDPNSASKVYAENVREDANAALRGLLVREALDYGLASAETSFIAVRREAGTPIEGTVGVANALPSGWSDSFLTRSGGAPTGALFAASMPPSPSPMPPPKPTARPKMAKSDLRDREEGGLNFQPGQILREITDKLLGGRADAKTKGRPVPEPEAVTEKENAPWPDAAPMEEAPLDADEVGDLEYEMEKKEEDARTGRRVLFAGVPSGGGEVLLFDSDAQPGALPSYARLTSLILRFPDGDPDARTLDRDLTLLLFVGDLAVPRAQVKVADLARMRGSRPLNLTRQSGETVRLVLADPNGAWAQGAPRLEVAVQVG